MFKLISTFIVGFLVVSTTAFGQTSSTNTNKKKSTIGFYGKRLVLQFGAGMHHNSILKVASRYERNLRNDSYYENYRNQTNSDQFNYSIYGNIGVVIGKRATFSVDFNYYFGNMVLQDYGAQSYYDEFGNYYSNPGVDGRISYNTIRIMPRIEIGGSGSNAPVGLVNVLGIGVEMSKAKSGKYLMIDEQGSNYLSQPYEKNMTFVDEYAFNLSVQYGLEYRLPISKNIAWNFGGYIHLNLPVTGIFNDFSTYNYYSSDNQVWDNEIKYRLVKTRFQNLFSVRTGIVIML
jgi:hypothetical protein